MHEVCAATLIALSMGACGRIDYDLLSAGGADGASVDADAAGLDAALLDAAGIDAAGRDAAGLDSGGGGVDAGPLHDDPDPSMLCPISSSGVGSSGNNSIGGATRGNGFAGSCGGRAGDEDRIQLSFGSPGDYVITSFGTAFDTVLYARDGDCSGPELACSDDVDGRMQSRIRLTVRPRQNVILFIDGGGASAGMYQLSAHLVGESEAAFCFDGMDNDGDGDVDCLDNDCTTLDPLCP